MIKNTNMSGLPPNSLVSKTISAVEVFCENELLIETNTQIRLDTPNLLVNFQPFDQYIRNLVFGADLAYPFDRTTANITQNLVNGAVNITESFNNDGTYEVENVFCSNMDARQSYILDGLITKCPCISISSSNSIRFGTTGNITYTSNNSTLSLGDYIYNILNRTDDKNNVPDPEVPYTGTEYDISNFGTFHTNRLITSNIKTSSNVHVGYREPIFDIISDSAINLQIYGQTDVNIASNIYIGSGDLNLKDYVYSFLDEKLDDFDLEIVPLSGVEISFTLSKFSNIPYGNTFEYDLDFMIIDANSNPPPHFGDFSSNLILRSIRNDNSHSQSEIFHSFGDLTTGQFYDIYCSITNTKTNTVTLYKALESDIPTIPVKERYTLTIDTDRNVSVDSETVRGLNLKHNWTFGFDEELTHDISSLDSNIQITDGNYSRITVACEIQYMSGETTVFTIPTDEPIILIIDNNFQYIPYIYIKLVDEDPYVVVNSNNENNENIVTWEWTYPVEIVNTDLTIRSNLINEEYRFAPPKQYRVESYELSEYGFTRTSNYNYTLPIPVVSIESITSSDNGFTMKIKVNRDDPEQYSIDTSGIGSPELTYLALTNQYIIPTTNLDGHTFTNLNYENQLLRTGDEQHCFVQVKDDYNLVGSNTSNVILTFDVLVVLPEIDENKSRAINYDNIEIVWNSNILNDSTDMKYDIYRDNILIESEIQDRYNDNNLTQGNNYNYFIRKTSNFLYEDSSIVNISIERDFSINISKMDSSTVNKVNVEFNHSSNIETYFDRLDIWAGALYIDFISHGFNHIYRNYNYHELISDPPDKKLDDTLTLYNYKQVQSFDICQFGTGYSFNIIDDEINDDTDLLQISIIFRLFVKGGGEYRLRSEPLQKIGLYNQISPNVVRLKKNFDSKFTQIYYVEEEGITAYLNGDPDSTTTEWKMTEKTTGVMIETLDRNIGYNVYLTVTFHEDVILTNKQFFIERIKYGVNGAPNQVYTSNKITIQATYSPILRFKQGQVRTLEVVDENEMYLLIYQNNTDVSFEWENRIDPPELGNYWNSSPGSKKNERVIAYGAYTGRIPIGPFPIARINDSEQQGVKVKINYGVLVHPQIVEKYIDLPTFSWSEIAHQYLWHIEEFQPTNEPNKITLKMYYSQLYTNLIAGGKTVFTWTSTGGVVTGSELSPGLESGSKQITLPYNTDAPHMPDVTISWSITPPPHNTAVPVTYFIKTNELDEFYNFSPYEHFIEVKIVTPFIIFHLDSDAQPPNYFFENDDPDFDFAYKYVFQSMETKKYYYNDESDLPPPSGFNITELPIVLSIETITVYYKLLQPEDTIVDDYDPLEYQGYEQMISEFEEAFNMWDPEIYLDNGTNNGGLPPHIIFQYKMSESFPGKDVSGYFPSRTYKMLIVVKHSKFFEDTKVVFTMQTPS